MQLYLRAHREAGSTTFAAVNNAAEASKCGAIEERGAPMSRSVGAQLPQSIYELMDGAHLDDRVGFTALLLTTDADGWTTVAMLSAGEFLATSPSAVSLALWPGTTAAANLTHRSRATLALVADGSGYYIRADFRREQAVQAGGARHVIFRGDVVDVLEDRVTYATVTSGITFALHDRERVVAGWRSTIAALRGFRDVP
jgi:hypothetical protein